MKKARERKLRDRKSPAPRCDIYLEKATVTVQFKTEASAPKDVADALRAALEAYLRENPVELGDPVSPKLPNGPHPLKRGELPTNGYHAEEKPELASVSESSR